MRRTSLTSKISHRDILVAIRILAGWDSIACQRQGPLQKEFYQEADFPPHYKNTANGAALSVPSTKFPELSEDAFAATSQPRIPPPLKPFDFLPLELHPHA
ncbi:hypothetical protein IW261DRAFT_264020 [Armillaria novae-zelandiae]|uniref:Uncharacterized protein n=1 Tax=Armillaria novae-zelandiae TaxID=153914 RepID=A0AA39TQV9_9AGAR|nr:hypothetical protein IW261DRAFT_264020 [Armillaria novae-zelandiae]